VTSVTDSKHTAAAEPWQLAMFRKSLKKQQRYALLKALLAPLAPADRCLLVTCGDNNGAMNHGLRALGGTWRWADFEQVSIAEMSALLGDPVVHATDEHVPFDDASFDRVVAIDVHEHVDDPQVVTAELTRILKPGGQLIITTPNGDERKLAVRIKHLVGMSKEAYGHKRVGLTAQEIGSMMAANAVRPVTTEWFSGFFTEMLELSINLVYVKLLSRRGAQPDPGLQDHPEIAPATAEQLRKVQRSFRIYSIIYPVYRVLSQLDRLLPRRHGYCVVVVGRRES
jgi:SAM-dependent methyltransferase